MMAFMISSCTAKLTDNNSFAAPTLNLQIIPNTCVLFPYNGWNVMAAIAVILTFQIFGKFNVLFFFLFTFIFYSLFWKYHRLILKFKKLSVILLLKKSCTLLGFGVPATME